MSEHSSSEGASKVDGSNPSKPENSKNCISKEFACILGAECSTATFFSFNGVRILEGGLTTKTGKYEETLDEITAIILSAPTLENLGSTVALFEKDAELPVLSHTGPLNSVVKGRSGAMFKRIQEVALKSLIQMPVFDPKYPAYTIHQSAKNGTLSLFVLAGTRQEGEAIAKALSVGNEDDVDKLASKNGTVAVLLWRPNVADKPVVRVLLSGTCSSLRIQESLDKASKFLPFLNAPTIQSSDAFKVVPAPAASKPSNVRPLKNTVAAKPPKPATNAPRARPLLAMSGRTAQPSSVESARTTKKHVPAPIKSQKPPIPSRPPVTLRGSAPTRAHSSGTLTKAAPASGRASAPQSRPNTALGNFAARKPTQPGNRNVPIASKKPTTKPAIPVTRKTSRPIPKAQEVSSKPVGKFPGTTKPKVKADASAMESSPAPVQQEHTLTADTPSNKFCSTIQLDSTLKSQDQSSIIFIREIENPETSQCSIFQPIRERISPVYLGDMNVSEGTNADIKIKAELDLNENTSSGVERKMEAGQITKTAKGDVTHLAEGLQKLAIDDVNDNEVKDVVHDIIDQLIGEETKSSAGRQVIVDVEQLVLEEDISTCIQDVCRLLVEEAAKESDLLNSVSPDTEEKALLPASVVVVDKLVSDIETSATTVNAMTKPESITMPEIETDDLEQLNVSSRPAGASAITTGTIMDQQGTTDLNARIESKAIQPNEQNNEVALPTQIDHPMLKKERRAPLAAFKPIKFSRSYYFDLVKLPRDENSRADANIQEFVSKIRSKYLILPSDNISESQLQAVINGKGTWREGGRSCTIIPTHTSESLNDFLAKNQVQSSANNLSFEVPLNEGAAGDSLGVDKRKIHFD